MPTPEKRYQRAGSVPCTTSAHWASKLLLQDNRQIGLKDLSLKDNLQVADAVDGCWTVEGRNPVGVQFFQEVKAPSGLFLPGIVAPEPVCGDQTLMGCSRCLERGFWRVPDPETKGMVFRAGCPGDESRLPCRGGGELTQLDAGRHRKDTAAICAVVGPDVVEILDPQLVNTAIQHCPIDVGVR